MREIDDLLFLLLGSFIVLCSSAERRDSGGALFIPTYMYMSSQYLARPTGTSTSTTVHQQEGMHWNIIIHALTVDLATYPFLL